MLTNILKSPAILAKRLRKSPLGQTSVGRSIVDTVLYPYDRRAVRGKFLYAFGHKPSLRNPRTFNEHITSTKLFGRAEVQIKLADKLAVRDYVTEKIGSQFLSRVLWRGKDIQGIPREAMPQRFVLKANHISGDVIVCHDKATFDWEEASERTKRWLGLDYSEAGCEWQYRWIEPELFIEEFLDGGQGKVPEDYKFFCFDGRVRFLQVDQDRFSKHSRTMLDRDFRPLPFSFCYPRFQGEITKPASFDQMIILAEKLAAGLRFVRVDFYDVGRPIFGEMTFHPDGGIGRFEPPEWDGILGRLFRDPKANLAAAGNAL